MLVVLKSSGEMDFEEKLGWRGALQVLLEEGGVRPPARNSTPAMKSTKLHVQNLLLRRKLHRMGGGAVVHRLSTTRQ